MIAKVTMKALCSFIITLLCGVGSLSAGAVGKIRLLVARDGYGIPYADRSNGGYPRLYGL